MAVPFAQSAFVLGEVAPALYGRFDLARFHVGASTCRNFFVRYQGGASTRPGTAFVGFSKQTGRNYPPRLIPFQFNINQGIAIELGNFYARFIANGEFVTEQPVAITGATQSNPATITAAASGSTAATPIDTGVMATYAPGDLVTLAGGVGTPAILRVTNTKLVSLTLNSPGSGVWAPGDTATLTGGTQTTNAVLTVNKTQAVSATVVSGGTSGTDGTAVVTGTTGTGTPFQATVTISGGSITAILSISLGGLYSVNPTLPSAEPVTGGGLSGATLNVKLGIATFSIFNAGVFTVNPSGGLLAVATPSGSGTGGSFQQAVLGPHAVTVSSAGVYTTFPVNPVAQASTTGSGVGATFTVTFASTQAFNVGDWVFVAAISGMTQLNGQMFVVAGVSGTTYSLNDVYGNPINSTAFNAYISGGIAARIYTLTTIYSEVDLPYLKFTQSADEMSLCCVNQVTGTEYPPQDLERLADDNWVFTPVVPAPTVQPPMNVSGAASAGGSTYYQYAVTSVNPKDGTESIASNIANIPNAVDVAATAGTITISWTPVPGVNEYNIYKAPVTFDGNAPAGALFGYAGSSFGTQFTDSNIVADLTQVPPTDQNPFAEGAIISVSPVAGGSAFTEATVTINTSTGSGAIVLPIIVGGVVVGYITENSGRNYLPTDTVTVTGDGTGATASLTVGPQTGTFPAVPAYFQERRVYGYTTNDPDTYFMSQPGSFTNYDSRTPTIDSDAIIGSPWSQQVNGIQAMVPRPGGLVVMTGSQAWQLTGTGGSSLNPQPITPTTEQAQPQAFNGCSPTVPPIPIDQEILYVQSKGSIVRDLTYQYFQNIYTGTDLTLNSSHLFTGHSILEWAWAEEPYKTVWAVRDDGIMLSLAFVKAEQIMGWGRHDTNGFFKSVCSIVESNTTQTAEFTPEPNVDALYVATQRFPGTNTCYMIERMDERFWGTVEDAWCVDAGLSLPQPAPSAILKISSAIGIGVPSAGAVTNGGSGYSTATTFQLIDNNGQGPGTGAVVTGTIVGGIVTAFSISGGAGYVSPRVIAVDPAGSDGGGTTQAATFTGTVVLTDTATLAASANVFAASNIGNVVRAAGGIATILSVGGGGTTASVQITSPFTQTIPNSGGLLAPIPSGQWTMTMPVSTLTGLNHLAGATVTGLADGQVIPPQVVSVMGTVTLAMPSTAIVVGLGFTAQLQTLYADMQGVTQQGQRKKLEALTARVEASRGFQTGANQLDGSTLSPMQIAPAWSGLVNAPDLGVPAYGSSVVPLATGDIRVPLTGGFNTKGQAAFQQSLPLPLTILAVIPEELPGDTVQLEAPKRQNHANMPSQQ